MFFNNIFRFILQEIVELAGYTYRVGVMFDVFDDVSRGKYVRNGIVAATKQHPSCPLRFNSNGQIIALGKSFLSLGTARGGDAI